MHRLFLLWQGGDEGVSPCLFFLENGWLELLLDVLFFLSAVPWHESREQRYAPARAFCRTSSST